MVQQGFLEHHFRRECKPGALIDMVCGCTSLGVALRASELRRGDLKMELERWPLVQAHAYDEHGQGFLTMQRSVVNLENHLQQFLFPAWDYPASSRLRVI